MSNVGKKLEPTKFGLGNESNPAVDRFGQPAQTPLDETHGDVPTSMATKDAHRQSDVDSSPHSQHHTLGTARSQASPGNHIHDGFTSPKLGPMNMDPAGNVTVPALSISGSRGGNAAVASIIALLQNVINFTDNTTA